MTREDRSDGYGTYVQATGSSIGDWEHVFSEYILTSRFAGRRQILELGPGRCSFLRLAPERIIGLDLSPSLVDAYSQQGLDLRFGSVNAIPLPDCSLDAVYACWLFEHLADPETAAREIWRVLRPGGYACIIVPSADSLQRGFYDDYTHVRPFTCASLHLLAVATGFSRFRSTNLFCTRGLGRLLPFLSEQRVLRLIRMFDRDRRRVGLVNRNNLALDLLEVIQRWQPPATILGMRSGARASS